MDWTPVFLSIKTAGFSVIIVGILGLFIAYFMARHPFPGKDILEVVLTLPLVMPPVVTGFLLLMLIGKNGPVGKFLDTFFHTQLIFTPAAAILAAAVVSFPLMYQSSKAAFLNIERQLEDAARTLNASETKIFLTITLPLAWPGLISGLVMSFSRALGEFGATAMVAGNIPGRTQTIPVAIYFASEGNDLAKAGFYVLVISVITFILVFWGNQWSQNRMRRNTGGKTGNVKCND